MPPNISFDEDALLSQVSPFRPLIEQIESHDVGDVQGLHAGFTRVLRGEEAKSRQNVVFIWAVAKPYRHCDGKCGLSRIVYIEKTNGSIFSRWPPKYISLLAQGASDEEPEPDVSWRTMANCASNGLFYRAIISALGPLRVWWSDVGRLNEKLGCELRTPREWERQILKQYRGLNGCLPLKNRRC